MSRPFIVVGDRTTHGGHVISGDVTFDIDGKPVARVGDMTVCPKCRGTFAITSGADDVSMNGARCARHLDTTACGAKLLAGQVTAFWDAEALPGDAAGSDQHAEALAAASRIAAPASSGLCLDCLLKSAASGSAAILRE